MVVGTWLGVGIYYDRKSWHIKLLKHYRVWRAFVVAQRQRQRLGSVWLVLRAFVDVGTWPHSSIGPFCLCVIQAVPCDTL